MSSAVVEKNTIKTHTHTHRKNEGECRQTHTHTHTHRTLLWTFPGSQGSAHSLTGELAE